MDGAILTTMKTTGVANAKTPLEVLNMIGFKKMQLIKEKKLLMGTKLTIG